MQDIFPTAMKLNQDAMARLTQNLQCSGRIAMSPPSAGRFQEAMELALATSREGQKIQARWVDGWLAWADYASTLEGADTLPKVTERISNIGLRAQAQMASQVTDTTDFLERLSVNYAYWMTQQLPAED